MLCDINKRQYLNWQHSHSPVLCKRKTHRIFFAVPRLFLPWREQHFSAVSTGVISLRRDSNALPQLPALPQGLLQPQAWPKILFSLWLPGRAACRGAAQLRVPGERRGVPGTGEIPIHPPAEIHFFVHSCLYSLPLSHFQPQGRGGGDTRFTNILNFSWFYHWKV